MKYVTVVISNCLFKRQQTSRDAVLSGGMEGDNVLSDCDSSELGGHYQRGSKGDVCLSKGSMEEKR